MINIILKDARVISPEDNINEIVDIKIENGIITALQNNISGEGIDMTGKLVTPGFVEMHCHLREPGFEYKETIETGINSAISGGYTAICPMANTNPVVDNVDTIKFCLEKAAKTGKNILFPVCSITKNLAGEEVVDFKSLK